MLFKTFMDVKIRNQRSMILQQESPKIVDFIVSFDSGNAYGCKPADI